MCSGRPVKAALLHSATLDGAAAAWPVLSSPGEPVMLAPAVLWPSECSTEHGGLGWSVRVSAHVSSAAVRVALVHARTMAGASFSPALVRLAALLAPLSILRATPALGGTPAHLMPGRGGDGSGARALVRVPAAVSAADTPEPAPLPPGLSRGAHKASLPR